MEPTTATPASHVLVNCDLLYADRIIEELDQAIQGTGNLQLSQMLNEILDSYDTIRGLLKT